jgi:hypothetical protein
MSHIQRKKHEELTAACPSDAIREWHRMVEDWNANRNAPNPYTEPTTGKRNFYMFHYCITHF